MQEEQNINQDPSTGSGQGNNNEIANHNQYYSHPPLSKGQKIAVAVLAFFSFFVIVVWVIQFKQGISSPLNGSKTSVDTVVTDEESEEVDMTKDTDGDGLTDYNELNTYKTSPYLEDSDSDGFNDKMEIDSDKDPNCPTGATCSEIAPETTAPVTEENLNTQAPTTVSQTENQQSNLNLPTGTTGDTAEMQKVLSGQVDATSLRTMLISAGMDKAMLDKISDEDLMANYKETLAK